MSAPIPLRQDFDASQLRGLARRSKDGPQARRLLALAAIYDGATRTAAAAVEPAAHAILLADQAGWHMSTHLVVRVNVTIITCHPNVPSAQCH